MSDRMHMYDSILVCISGVIFGLKRKRREGFSQRVLVMSASEEGTARRNALGGTPRRLCELLRQVEQDRSGQTLELLHKTTNVSQRIRFRLDERPHDADVDEAATAQRRRWVAIARVRKGALEERSTKQHTHIFSLLGLSDEHRSFIRRLTQAECR